RVRTSGQAPLPAPLAGQASVIFPLATLMVLAGSGFGAGPRTTWASVTLYSLPWQGQSIVPSATLSTVQPMWVQIALKPLNSPFVGWVTTTFSAVKIFPPPTGISLVVPSAELSPELPPEPELPDPDAPPLPPPRPRRRRPRRRPCPPRRCQPGRRAGWFPEPCGNRPSPNDLHKRCEL